MITALTVGTFSSLAKLSSYVQTEIKKPSRVGSPACACEGFVIRVAGQITEGKTANVIDVAGRYPGRM